MLYAMRLCLDCRTLHASAGQAEMGAASVF
jgi:hypothetical protein